MRGVDVAIDFSDTFLDDAWVDFGLATTFFLAAGRVATFPVADFFVTDFLAATFLRVDFLLDAVGLGVFVAVGFFFEAAGVELAELFVAEAVFFFPARAEAASPTLFDLFDLFDLLAAGDFEALRTLLPVGFLVIFEVTFFFVTFDLPTFDGEADLDDLTVFLVTLVFDAEGAPAFPVVFLDVVFFFAKR